MYKTHDSDYKKDAFMNYTLDEFAGIISFYIKRADMRTDLEKKNKDLYDANNYRMMMNAKIDAMLDEVE